MSFEKQNIILAQTDEEAALVAEDIKSEDVAKDSGRAQKSTPGVGTDIFVRKKKPGSQVGKGYFVDIYENGVKIDTIELSTKKEVTKLIKKFKDKYNTDRAFQNEMQIHITYKTKKERGEPTMASIDNILLKKAHKIQELLHRITEPELPLIKRFGQEGIPGDITSVPETPPAGAEDKESIKRFIADEIIKKFTDFVNQKSEVDPGAVEEPELDTEAFNVASNQEKSKSAAIDDLFNPLRKWYGKLSRKIEEWNNMSGNMLGEADIRDIIQQTEKIIMSQNPDLIQQNTGIAVSPETANLMYEVGSKSVGKPGEAEEGGELGGNPADFQEESTQEMPKAAKFAEDDKKQPTIENTNDLLQSFTKNVQTQISSMPISDIAKDLNVVDNDILQKMHAILSEKDGLVEAETAIKKYIEDCLNLERKSSLHPSIIESKTKEFWKFASEYKGIANIEDVFVDWANKEGCGLKEATSIWQKVDEDIMKNFGFSKNKFAGPESSIGDIFFKDNTTGDMLFSGYLEYDQPRNRFVVVPYEDPQNVGYATLAPLVPDYENAQPLGSVEEAVNEAPKVLKRFTELSVVAPMARALLSTKKDMTELEIKTDIYGNIGGPIVDQLVYKYKVSPYGEDVTI